MMKKMLAMTLLLAGSVQAQTGLIAHKSHSGTAASFGLASSGNFGIPSSRLVKVTWLNDSTVTTQNDRWGGERVDTIYNHPVFSDPNMPVDTMAKMYNYGVKFENFDKKTVAPVKENPEQQKNTDAEKVKEPVNSNPTTEQPTKKKSNLFWLWIVGGGTFTGILLVSGRKKQPHYA